ncbi:GNVR domain-containing protein [Oceanisphaera sp. W20_SRM_FM3]|uniref:GNVR domain-containing protein n=1 Tax=Oceanisphaera sp. W20_SRM_FM3 TaxID=3240267 RepID=UPI003F99F38F
MTQVPQRKDAEFSQPMPRHAYQDDEISLVDLAKTLVKRWRLMLGVFLVVVFGGLAYALTLSTPYEYTTIYSGAEASPGTSLESTASLESKVNSLYIPQQTRHLLQTKQLEKLPFKVTVSIPKDTNLITLTSKAQEADKDLVTDLHHGIITQLKAEQDRQTEQRVSILQQRLDAAKEQLKLTMTLESNKSGEIATALMASVSSLESDISSFANGRIVDEVSQSLQPKGISKSLIMVLAIVLGGMLAVMAVFVREFSSKVCSSLKEDN